MIPETPPLLSIVVASYTLDRLTDLLEVTDSISRQTYEPIETIIVVQESRELYAELHKRVPSRAERHTRIVFNGEEPGLSANRNLGVRLAQGQIVAFVDDDVILAPDWAEQVMTTFKDETVIGVTGPALPLWQDEPATWLPREFSWLISCTAWVDRSTVREVRTAWGHGMAFHRQAFESAGLFRTDFGLRGRSGPLAEDNEFSVRVRAKTGKRILFNPAAVINHKVYAYRLTWRYIAQRSYEVGRSRYLMLGAGGEASASGGEDALDPEVRLLRRIVTNLIPQILGNLVRQPGTGLRQLSLASVSLFFVGAGFLVGLGQSTFTRSKKGNLGDA